MSKLALAALLAISYSQTAWSHCQVPCGVYGDQRRFEEMLEDATTIAKGIAQINELSSKSDALSKNQLVRWVNTKESHASNTQKIIAEYFMTQRLKADADGYVKKLTSAHAVMVAAMKCKQTTDAASAAALRKAILGFYEAYEGRKPDLE
jgi:nickel superoxide dismutase